MGHVKDSNDLQSGGGVAAACRALKRNHLRRSGLVYASAG